MPLIAR
jgi:uncharacterized protein (TIGR03435 family)